MMQLNTQQKFEALCLCYKSHTKLLRFMTKNDFQIFGGYMTLQILLGGWLNQKPSLITENEIARAGILLIDFVLSLIVAFLLFKDYLRRKEVVKVMENLKSALGYSEQNTYLRNKVLIEDTPYHRWVYTYIFGVFVSFLGIFLLIFSEKISRGDFMDPRWFSVIGLIFDLIGASVLAWGLIISKKEAIKLGTSRYGGKSDEENLKIPAVKDRIIQSRNAKIGLAFLVIGFLLQIVGNWPK